MYNRYIPNGTAYTRVVEQDADPFRQPEHRGEPPRQEPEHHPHPEPHPEHQEHHQEPVHHHQEPVHHQEEAPRPQAAPVHGPGPRQNQPPPPIWEAALGGKKPASWLSGLLKNFKLDDLDTGDILLLLIILFLFIDGDDLELVITLGLLLLFGLGGKEEKEA